MGIFNIMFDICRVMQQNFKISKFRLFNSFILHIIVLKFWFFLLFNGFEFLIEKSSLLLVSLQFFN